jgi:hypothetical protein
MEMPAEATAQSPGHTPQGYTGRLLVGKLRTPFGGAMHQVYRLHNRLAGLELILAQLLKFDKIDCSG